MKEGGVAMQNNNFRIITCGLSQEEINIVISSDGLTTANTLQIQDIVTNQTEIDLSKIKIIPIK